MRIPKRGEKGFTLIELLIVVAILGVLAAVVIPNVGRFLGRGEQEAGDTELSNVQSAVVAMMVDQGVANFTANSANLCDGSGTGQPATNLMYVFPCQPYVLYACNASSPFNINYVVQPTTKGTYTCDVYGTVNQTTSGYE